MCTFSASLTSPLTDYSAHSLHAHLETPHLNGNPKMNPSTISATNNKRSKQSPASRSQKRVRAESESLGVENIYTETQPTLKANVLEKHMEKRCEMPFSDNDSMEAPKLTHRLVSQPNNEHHHNAQTPEDSEFDTNAALRGIADKSAELCGIDPPESPGWRPSYSDGHITPDDDDEALEPGTLFPIENLDEELGRWTAPPEPLRPTNPYKKGQIFEMRKHIACPPFGSEYPHYEGVPEESSERYLRSTTLVELCLDRPAPRGETVTNGEPQTLEIVKEIRSGYDSGAQIVVCRFSGSQDEVVAKIYDPLYYGFAHRMWSDQPRDVVYEAHMDYCREVAAYSELDDTLGGKEIPKYHGPWTIQLPLELPDRESTLRDVPLVLMEYIRGTQMTYLSPESVPESVRMEIVTRLVETRSKIHFAGVRHRDVSQRNIMVCLVEPDVVERVAFVDFNFAVVDRLDNFEEQFRGMERDPKPNKPPNPIDAWWGGALYGVAGEWLPKSWEMRLRACQEWLYKRYGSSEDYERPQRRLRWDEENLPRMWIAT